MARVTKDDFDFLCGVTLDLAFVAQRINRELDRKRPPSPGRTAYARFLRIDRDRLKALADCVGYGDGMEVCKRLLSCYDEVQASRVDGWRRQVFGNWWHPDLYDIYDPTKSMSVAEWGMLPEMRPLFTSRWGANLTPLCVRLSQHGQIRTLVDVAKALNDEHRFADLAEFGTAFRAAIEPYMTRGTISDSAVRVFESMIKYCAFSPEFRDEEGEIKFDKLWDEIQVEILDERGESLIDGAFMLRASAVLMRLTALLNDIMHYDSPDPLIADLRLVLGESKNLCWMPPGVLSEFSRIMTGVWCDAVDPHGRLISKALERRTFDGQGPDGVAPWLAKRIEDEYFPDGPGGSDSIVRPKEEWSGPMLYRDRFWRDHCSGEHMYVKACGGEPVCELYEFEMIKPVLDREVLAGNYECADGFYIPKYDVSLPIFRDGYGRVVKMCRDTYVALMEWHRWGRLPR